MKKIIVIILGLLYFFTYLLYKPVIPLFFEGDDFQVLWHIRTPVSFWQKPFEGWTMPIAGRFGYGQAWYESAVTMFAGSNNFIVLNSFGIFLRMLLILSVFYLAYCFTKNKIVAFLSSVFITFLATGIESTYYVFHHVVLVFMILVFMGLGLISRAFESEDGNWKKLILGFGMIFTGCYLYTIRMAGLVGLPLWLCITYFTSASVSRKKLMFWGFGLTALLFLIIYAIVPGISSVSKNINISLVAMIRSENNMFPVYSEAFLVSLGNMIFPPNLVDFLLKDGFIKRKILYLGLLPVVLSLIFVAGSFVVIYRVKAKLLNWTFVLQCVVLTLNIIWFVFLILLHTGNISYLVVPRFRFIAALGVSTALSILSFGLFEIRNRSRVAGLMLIGLSGIVIFYIPNWLFGAEIISHTGSRYFSVSSGFLAITLGSAVYLVGSLFWKLNYISKFNPMLKLIPLALLLVFGYISGYFLYFHTIAIQEQIKVQIDNRDAKRSLESWRVLNSNVDKQNKPIVVMIAPLGDLTDVKRLFFGRNGLALALDLPITDEMPYMLSTFKEVSETFCAFKKDNIKVEESNLYVFSYDINTGLHPKIEEGREIFKSWQKYCADGTPGRELIN